LVTNLSEKHDTIIDDLEPRPQLHESKPLPLVEINRTHTAFVQKLPQALSYVTELDAGAHAILFYDNLVAAGEYLCAFIEEGIRRQQTTVFLGLSTERYVTLFDQIGVNVATLENCGYLRHLSTRENPLREESRLEEKQQLNLEVLLRSDIESNCQGARFILLNEYPLCDVSFRELMGFERWLNTRGSSTALCCYNARQVLDQTYYNLFIELLKAHGHCLFQGIALPTNMITGNYSTSYTESKSMKRTDAIAPISH